MKLITFTLKSTLGHLSLSESIPDNENIFY